eukprot:365398-Chlamydomonas_euryale.AAC.3
MPAGAARSAMLVMHAKPRARSQPPRMHAFTHPIQSQGHPSLPSCRLAIASPPDHPSHTRQPPPRSSPPNFISVPPRHQPTPAPPPRPHPHSP